MGLKDIKFIESNIIGTYNLYKSLKLLKPKCIFYISSRDIYGQVKKNIKRKFRYFKSNFIWAL
jgi:nucleoside-diphosphate-sugar epimerase